jgi:hypothetical protein
MRRHLALFAPILVLPAASTCTAPGEEGEAVAAQPSINSSEARLFDFLVNGQPLSSDHATDINQ